MSNAQLTNPQRRNGHAYSLMGDFLVLDDGSRDVLERRS
jgi:hypothetical protein